MPFVHLTMAMLLTSPWRVRDWKTHFSIERALTDIGGTTVPVIDPEDLVIAKILAGRPKDIEDARNLWRLHGREFDHDRIPGHFDSSKKP